MAIVTAQAKLYTGIRCWCVDKNITANLSAAFSVGNYNRPLQPAGEFVLYPNILPQRLKRTYADLLGSPNISLTDERYKTYGGGNNVITASGVDNTNNWKVRFNLTCSFPTYIEIDVEKLGLPEGTDVVLHFEEGWLFEDRGRQLPSGAWEYPSNTQGALSPQQDNFVSFRTPWFGVSRLTSTFNRNIVPLRIKPLQSTINGSSNLIAYGIFNPGKLAALFGGVFITTPNAVKKTENVLTLYAFTGGGSQIWNNSFFTRIRPFEAIQTSAFTLPAFEAIKYKGVGSIALQNPVTLNTTAIRNIGPITASLETSSNMNVTAIKITNITELEPIVSSLSASATKITGVLTQNLQAFSSLSGEGSVPLKLTWTTTTANQRLALPVYFGSVNAQVTWGDGQTTTHTSPGLAPNYVGGVSTTTCGIGHTYTTPGTYTVTISGNIQNWGFTAASQWTDVRDWNSHNYHQSRIRMVSWGYIGIETLVGAHANILGYSTANRSVPSRLPPTVKDISYIFAGINGGNDTPLADWDQNQIANWDVSNVQYMQSAFARCKGNFNTNLGSWNVSNVQNFNSMFYGANRFTGQGLGNWNTSSATDMGYMFYSSAMNTSLNNWDVNTVTNFQWMFAYANVSGGSFDNSADPNATGYTGTLYNWDLSSANRAALSGMLYSGYPLILDLSSWCVPNVASVPDNFISPGSSYSIVWGACPGPRAVISSITADKTSVVEGDSVTFTINVSNWTSGTLYYRVNGGYPTYEYPNNWGGYYDQTGQPYNQDIDAFTGSISITSGVGTLVVPIPTDGLTEIGEYFRIDMLSVNTYYTPTSTNPYILGSTPVITIQANNT